MIIYIAIIELLCFYNLCSYVHGHVLQFHLIFQYFSKKVFYLCSLSTYVHNLCSLSFSCSLTWLKIYIFAICIDGCNDIIMYPTCIGPSVLTVNIAKNIENSSIVVQWDIVDDSLITTYTITWSRVGGGLQTATLAEKASRTITGLTLNTVYIITVGAANMCGSGPEFSTTILLSVATTSATSSISPTVPVSTSSTDSMSISNANPSSTIVITTTNPMTISTTASTPTISVINPSITTTDSVITTESKNITTISNIETTTTTVNITKQFTSAVSFSTSPNIVDENSKLKG